MGLADRDYMRERGKPGSRKGSGKIGRLNAQPTPFNFLTRVLVFIGIILVLTWIFDRPGNPRIPPWQSLFQSKAPSIPLPETGNVTLYQLGQRSPAIAGFKIIASASGTEAHHLVKLVDAVSNQPVLSVFVRNGETATIKVPLGTYKVNMAQGTRWYGETKMFGRDMHVSQGIASLEFSAKQNSVIGQRLELNGTINGNFPTRPLAVDRF